MLGVAAVLPLDCRGWRRAIGERAPAVCSATRRWHTGRYGRGTGGQIALLRAVPRTATVTAHTAATVYRLDRDLFLTAVLGHAPTRLQADRIAAARLAPARQLIRSA